MNSKMQFPASISENNRVRYSDILREINGDSTNNLLTSVVSSGIKNVSLSAIIGTRNNISDVIKELASGTSVDNILSSVNNSDIQDAVLHNSDSIFGNGDIHFSNISSILGYNSSILDGNSTSNSTIQHFPYHMLGFTAACAFIIAVIGTLGKPQNTL